MNNRLEYATVKKQLLDNPAVAILGPRQVGKTTFAKQLASSIDKPYVFLDLARASDLAKLDDAAMYLKSQLGKLVIIDEIQRLPTLLPVLNNVIELCTNNNQQNTQFLLLGSAALSLNSKIPCIELAPFNLIEANIPDANQLWLRGGFPSSFLAPNDELSLEWRENFIRDYLERDLPQLGPRVSATTMRKFLTILAHNNGQILNQSDIATSLGVSATSIRRYLDILGDLMLIRPLNPWSGDIKKRLIKSPKYYIRDSGLLHALLNIKTIDALLSHPIHAKSWEGFVIENLLSIAPKRATPVFFATVAKAAIDLVFVLNSTEKIALQITSSLTPTLTRGFYTACEDLGITQKYLVYPGQDSLQLKSGVTVVSLGHIMQLLLKSSIFT